MRVARGFRYQSKPRPWQRQQMRQYAGAVRLTYNAALRLQNARRNMGGSRLGIKYLCRQLTECRNDPELSWLRDAPVHILQRFGVKAGVQGVGQSPCHHVQAVPVHDCNQVEEPPRAGAGRWQQQ